MVALTPAPRVHVIGAGVAGLSAAVRLADGGFAVKVHEAAKQAGGRCRSFYDGTLQATIDNGTHLVLSGNRDLFDFVDRIGAGSAMHMEPRAAFDFVDLSSDARWCVDLGAGGRGGLPGWLWDRSRQPPGLHALSFARDVWALRQGAGKTVAECLDPAAQLYRTFWQPICLAALNTAPAEGAASLLWAVLRDTVLKGGAFARPVYAPDGLSAALIDPAVEALRGRGVEVNFGHRLRILKEREGRIEAIDFGHFRDVLRPQDAVVLALPDHAAATLMGELGVPLQAPLGSRSILNVHYRVRPSCARVRMLGVIGGDIEWLFQRQNIVSVTVSGAAAWMDKKPGVIAQTLWPEVSKALGLDGPALAHRVIKERHATFHATVSAAARRPGSRTALNNLYVAGDWTDTGLPASLESAVRSGRLAAQAVMEDHKNGLTHVA